MSTAVCSQVLIYTAAWTGASWKERTLELSQRGYLDPCVCFESIEVNPSSICPISESVAIAIQLWSVVKHRSKQHAEELKDETTALFHSNCDGKWFWSVTVVQICGAHVVLKLAIQCSEFSWAAEPVYFICHIPSLIIIILIFIYIAP